RGRLPGVLNEDGVVVREETLAVLRGRAVIAPVKRNRARGGVRRITQDHLFEGKAAARVVNGVPRLEPRLEVGANLDLVRARAPAGVEVGHVGAEGQLRRRRDVAAR